MPQNLAGLTAIVTGAGGGIGHATAVKLATEGVNVVLFGGHNLDKLDATRQEVEKHSKCLVLPGDLAETAEYPQMLAQVEKTFGGLDILVNNAGLALNEPFAEISEETYDRIMTINVRVPFFLTQKCLPLLRKSTRASIINIASVVSHAGYPRQSVYVASKHALLGFTKSLAAECYQDNIRVHAIAPGGVYTDMVKISRPDLTPDGMILPEDIADLVLFFLSNRSNAVVDEIIVHRV
ncbi:MAG: SDR family oxidoreductase, partial [Victivallales bacterium]|nr:SDR family oxidoreductase [Victivallales bacterium]